MFGRIKKRCLPADLDATQTSDYTQILLTTRCTVCTAVTSQLGFIQCWAPEVAYSVRQDSQLLGLQASEGPLQGWQTWDSSSGNVQSLQWQYAKPDLIWLHSLTSGEQKHVFFSGLSSISSHISSHVYYKWKSIFPACAGTYLREQSYQKTFWYFSVFPGGWMAHEQNMVVKTRLQKRFYLKSRIFLIQWRLNSLKN